MQNKSLVYFGSPDFSAGVLKRLYENSKSSGVNISLVITQPDKPAGRGLRLRETPVKALANKLNLEVFSFTKEKKGELIEKIRCIKPEYGVLYAFNEIIPEEILSLFPRGLWNLHPSILPLFRGPSPVAFPLILGLKETGVTIMKMEKGLDTGPVLAQNTRKIEPGHNHESLINLLSFDGYVLISNLLKQDKIVENNQDSTKATYTKKIKKDDGFVPIETMQRVIKGEKVTVSSFPLISDYVMRNKANTPGEYIDPEGFCSLARGLSPWPGIWTKVDFGGKTLRLKIFDVGYNPETKKIHIGSVQLEGRSPVSFPQWNNSYKIFSL